MSTCDYEHHSENLGLMLLELVHNREVTRSIFHDINYLKGDNYNKNKEQVATDLIANYQNMVLTISFQFFGYCLPDISFPSEQFSEAIYFNSAIFYGVANFLVTIFSAEAYFSMPTSLVEQRFNML